VKEEPAGEFFIWTLFQQLLRRKFTIGLDEYAAVQRALRAGFGWASRDELRELLCALWAKSREEIAVVTSLFDQYVISEWNLAAAEAAPAAEAPPSTETQTTGTVNESGGVTPPPPPQNIPPPHPPAVAPTSRMPPLRAEELPRLPYSHVFLPQYPVSYRHVAQTWRRLRWPLREGPAVELDVDATVARRSRSGVASPPVLRPRRRNQAHLLLLVDRKGSMAPFHGFVDEVCTAIAEAGRLGHVSLYNFHDTPLEGTDLNVLDRLAGQLLPSLDPILSEVPPLTTGEFYKDAKLLEPCSAESIFQDWTQETAIVIISDAGAARGHLDIVRLLDTVASLKGLLTFSTRLVWLNPLPTASWARSTARQIARHVPMFPMDGDGMHRAVNVLRGQPVAVERPLPRAGPRQVPKPAPQSAGALE
jgi:uncharacterized protein